MDLIQSCVQHPENVFSYHNSKLNINFMLTIQGGCFIIRTMNKTDSALNTSDIKLIYTKYSIGTYVINRGEFFFKVSMGSKQVPWMLRYVHKLVSKFSECS